jgi:hypothetical protein
MTERFRQLTAEERLRQALQGDWLGRMFATERAVKALAGRREEPAMSELHDITEPVAISIEHRGTTTTARCTRCNHWQAIDTRSYAVLDTDLPHICHDSEGDAVWRVKGVPYAIERKQR